jgi:hypothetical protein
MKCSEIPEKRLREVSNREIHKLYSGLNIIRIIKLCKKKCVGYLEGMETDKFIKTFSR